MRKSAAALWLVVCEVAFAQPAPAPGRWTEGEVTDQMSGERLKFASIRSDASLQLQPPYSGKNYGVIHVAQSLDGGYSVSVVVDKGQIVCIQECDVWVKFDTREILAFRARPPSDFSSNMVILRRGSLFYDWLAKSSRVKVQLLMFQSGSPVLEFTQNAPPKL